MNPPDSGYTAVIRARNSGATLRCVLHHLTRQTLPPRQLVLVDSGSTDRTIGIAESYGAEVVPYGRDDFNYARALNLGVAAAREPWILFLSADLLLLHPDFMEIFFDRLRRHQCDFGYANVTAAGPPRSLPFTGEVEAKVTDWKRYNGFNGLRNPCSLVRRADALERPFDESVITCEDERWAGDRLRKGMKSLELTKPAACKPATRRKAEEVAHYERIYNICHVMPASKRIRYLPALVKRCVLGPVPAGARREFRSVVRYFLKRLPAPQAGHFRTFADRRQEPETWIP